jgi:ATP-dependent exoDNAse (exonuclease V) beta subunit
MSALLKPNLKHVSRGELYILDYKDGRVKVEVEDNTQLMMYASAFIQMQEIRELSHIHLGILQPKISHEVLSTVVSMQDIHNFEHRVVEALNKIPNGANEFNAGHTAINISLMSGAAFLSATKSASLISGVSSFVTRIESANTVSRVVFIPDSAEPIHGTCDAVAFGTDGGELYILDYKDGRVKVEVEDNTQLMMYASAFIQGIYQVMRACTVIGCSTRFADRLHTLVVTSSTV